MKFEVSGSGLLASSAVYALRENHALYARSSLKTNNQKKFYSCHSSIRPHPIIGSFRKTGLSGFYHAVTPTEVLTDESNQGALQTLKLSGLNLPDGANFVPRIAPRPLNLALGLANSPCDVKVLANSVVGNLSYAIQQGWLNEADISDDICFSVGKITACDGFERIGRGFTVSKGALFPVLQFNKVQLTIRPVFSEVADIDFVSLRSNFKNANGSQLLEKFKCALYLRFGLLVSEPKFWKVFCQLNMASTYLITKNGIAESSKFKKGLYTEIESVRGLCKQIFPSIEIDKDLKILNGIHLGYDRTILSEVPNDIIIIDTSLCDDAGKHPTIASYCKAFNKLKYEFN